VEEDLSTALKVARIRVRSAVRGRALPSAYRDDFVQELLIACWLASDKFDPSRASLRTFFECVIASRLASAIRTARRRPAMQPLESVPEFGVAPPTMIFDLRSEVTRVLARLDVADRRVAVALMECSPAQASRNLNLARSTVYRHISRLRTSFIAAGITTSIVDRS
jgi:RNA polymerase sigma factor (sigma-70 family)